MKILLIRNDNIGDLICTTPAILALRKAYPNAQIDIVVNSLNACVVDKNPYLNKIHIYTKPKHKKSLFDKIGAFFKKCAVLFEIFRQKYDVAVIFRSHYSSSAALFAQVSRAKRVLGVDAKKPKKIITDKIKFSDDMHEVMLCYEILKPLGVVFGDEKTLYLPKNPSDKFKDFVFFHISSRMKENKITQDKIVTIAKFLKDTFKNVIITSEDSKEAQEISQKIDIQYLKTASLDDMANYLQCAKFLLTLEGGAMHLAPALGVKTFAIFGKSSTKRWCPWGDNVVVICGKDKIAQNVDLGDLFDKIQQYI
ncbi:glycosyltransferase family 9 protein [Campylobacter gastrosuis]|uniref:Glycosyltransferase family 9 protein n=1 Tax=Campylobacter gastrosuis TaxID=2974576 RepID=A0ABT7HLB6_9BACT|nr:glycosyltransferase family 9 protein [Campylobacter gastrosuis]MDL0087802.1 glycosyltransferase family 9 protein [Campylobacter gastrosuis]MDL0088013.1 glycosyltransferase family 9 protein [Campylobacter gastrosuis]